MFHQVPEIGVDKVPGDAALLDVREPDEWAAGHAEGALHIPMGEVVQRLDEIQQTAADADGPLYVVCRAGGRSAQVVNYLRQHDLDAINVDGGMQSWSATGRPLKADGPEAPFIL
ncbi:sulfurtransferase [Mangrovactinospora gilvigrisea]|uniref:Sulfurtransferase n=1 Tax=Mangrovactinospora gilvigrisea TaxID=1428644 RepID=A0A1J7BXG9_9ACTN|nr:rhodanese-like domain-containing protein [Mangrovactinospora gilvigrisea]OIV38185.1 sulfurtransferase [Mangrovactinospora gilvigrisea]